MIMVQKKYRSFLDDPDLKRWYESTARGSLITADVNLRRLGGFCERTGKTPHDLVAMDPRALTDLMDDFVTMMEKGTLSPNYIGSILKGVKSWLAHNNITLTRKIKVKNLGRNVLRESVPTQEELKRILASGDPRSRAACILMAHSGLRPEVIGNYKGTDGLTLGDLPELQLSGEEITFSHVPTLLVVRESLSKAGNEYFTFLGPEGCYYLKAYLEERIRSGQKLGGSSPIIVSSKAAYSNHFISTINIGDVIRQTIRKAGYSWRPYVLRGYFDSQLMLAETKGLIIRDYRTFFMGHTGDIEHTYTTRKIQTQESVENMRTSYEKALKFLETEAKGIQEEDYVKQLRESAIMAVEAITGLTFSSEEKDSLLFLNTEEFQEKLREVTKGKQAMAMNNGNKHKTVPEGKLEEYLNQGWELVQIYPRGDKAVIRLP